MNDLELAVKNMKEDELIDLIYEGRNIATIWNKADVKVELKKLFC